MVHDRSAGAGEMLAQQDMAQQKLYHVLEGELQVYKNGQPIATVGEGGFAGEVIMAQVFCFSGSDIEQTHKRVVVVFPSLIFSDSSAKLTWLHYRN